MEIKGFIRTNTFSGEYLEWSGEKFFSFLRSSTKNPCRFICGTRLKKCILPLYFLLKKLILNKYLKS